MEYNPKEESPYLTILGRKTNRNPSSPNESFYFNKPIFLKKGKINDDHSLQIDKKIIEIFGEEIDLLNPDENSSDIIEIKNYIFTDCTHQHIFFKNHFQEFIITNEIKFLKSFNFSLDLFQERAILCLENQQSVLVTAHTSSGKTVIAEYAISMALNQGKKVVYTSPIKALSNQKFRDFRNEFLDVGLMTGDVTKNSTAKCLVMTTEILRNMLYDKSSLLEDVSWIIFDEVHYIKDKVRGIVWEETLILLPKTIKCVFLSATIPNSIEFASWICYLKNQPMNIISTEKRSVPISHHLFCPFQKELLSIVDLKGNFDNKNWFEIQNQKNPENDNNSSNFFLDKYTAKEKYGDSKKNEKIYNIKILANKLHNIQLTPTIFFCFFKKECDEFVRSFKSHDYTTSKEKTEIEAIYKKAFTSFDKEEFMLPQIQEMLDLLKKGVAYHHSGLIPILKECVEILFQNGLIKFLFATETLAIGINMPTRSVVFTKMKKYDGCYRNINSSEFIQMCGRSGRRGKDLQGMCIMMLDDNKSENLMHYKNLLLSKPDNLNSSFQMRFNKILSILRYNGLKYEFIAKQSFYQFQAKQGVPVKKKEIKENYKEFKKYETNDKNNNSNFTEFNKEKDKEKIEKKIHKIVLESKNLLWAEGLTPGRLVKIYNYNWGILTSIKNQTKKKLGKSQNVSDIIENINDFICDVFVYIGSEPLSKINSFEICSDKFEIKSFPLTELIRVSKKLLDIPKSPTGKKYISTCAKRLIENLKGDKSLDIFDPEIDFKIMNDQLNHYKEQIYIIDSSLEKIKQENSLIEKDNHNKEQHKLKLYEKLISNIDELNELEKFILKDDIDKMENFLKLLKYINENEVTKKGIAASGISAANEILITEMMFNGHFDNISPNYLAAILSCFVPEAGRFTKDSSYFETPHILDYNLSSIWNKIVLEKSRISLLLQHCELSIQNMEIKPHFMEPVLRWANGVSFYKICNSTQIYEGNLISCLRRLEELLSQLIETSKSISNEVLEEKFRNASNLIRRGIVIEESLWFS